MIQPEPADKINPLSILLIGSGVIGSIYGGQLALAGHRLWVLAHGARDKEIVRHGIRLQNIGKKSDEIAKVELAKTAADREYDLVIVAVNANQLASTFPALGMLKGSPHIVFFGNNPDGHAALPINLPGTVELAFPGVAGNIKDGIVKYVLISQQPTTFEVTSHPLGKLLQTSLAMRGFPLRSTPHMSGWLAYHAVLIGCISMALLKSDTNPARLGHNPKLLYHMCRAIEEGFGALKTQRIKGLPLNLAVLHHPLLRHIAMHYWGGIMRSPKGKLYFADHARHSADEIHMLSRWVMKHCAKEKSKVDHLITLLSDR